jgi:hypothetical protein
LSDQNKVPEGTKSSEDFFDLLGEEGQKFKKKPEEKKPAQSKTGSGNAANKPEPKRYPAGMEIHHAGHKLALPKEMTEEEIYAFLSDDFPEVTAERAEIRHDKQKNCLEIAFKSFKKGAEGPRTLTVLTEPPSSKGGSRPPVFRLLGEGGVYEVRKTGLGTFIARVPCEREVREGFYPAIPKAPASLLAKTVRIFTEMPDREAVVNVVFDRQEGEFHLIWNEQSGATAGSVTYEPLPETERLLPYVEIHSHNRMPAFFSKTDDSYEVRSGLYGVIGRVHRPRPQAVFRYSCGGIFRPLRAEQIFHNPSGINVVDAVVEQPAP